MKKRFHFLVLFIVIVCLLEMIGSSQVSIHIIFADSKESIIQPATLSNYALNYSGALFLGIKDDISFASPNENDIYAVVYDGNIWHWNGAWWWQVTSGRLIEKRITAVSSDLIYGLSPQGNGYDVYQWNGSKWTQLTVNGMIRDDFCVVSNNEIYAIAQDNQVHCWNGSSWRQVTSGSSGVKNSIQVSSGNQIYGIGTQGGLLKWDGYTWQPIATGLNIEYSFDLKSENEIYAIDANNNLCVWNGYSWKNLSSNVSVSKKVIAYSPSEIYYVGSNKMVWQWNGEKMVQVTNSLTDTTDYTGSIFYRVKFIEGVLESPAAIIAFKDRLVIAGRGIGGAVYIREWQPLRNESWDAARNGQNLGIDDWYPLEGGTPKTPELKMENGLLYIYIEGNDGRIYRKEYLEPYNWSQTWEPIVNRPVISGPFSIAGFTVVPSKASGYPCMVSLMKFSEHNFTLPQSQPDWVKNMVLYEIVTKQFTSPNGPGTGTFKSAESKLDYLKSLGINAIWLSGHSWSDPRHFGNTSTQYSNIVPELIEPSLGTDPSNIEKTEQEFKELIQAAHQRGIRVIIDAIVHGVMSYSPLVTFNSSFPGYVASHPGSSNIVSHPDWFGAFTSPSDSEFPRDIVSFPTDTRMIDFVGGYDQSDLDDWWVNVWTNYVLDYGVDGIRLDLGSSRFDLWARVKENAVANGHQLVIMPEGEIDDYPFEVGVYDFEEASGVWSTLARPINNVTNPARSGIIVDDMNKMQVVFPQLSRQFYAIPISLHDCISYNLNRSRFRLGYGSIFTPFIPLFMAGEEFDNTYSPVSNNTLIWLLASELQWNELESTPKSLFFKDVQEAINLRVTEPALHYFSARGNEPNLVVIDNFTSSLSGTPAPYLRFVPNENETILILGNCDSSKSATIQVSIPFNSTYLGNSSYYLVEDLWSRDTFYISKEQLNEFKGIVKPDDFRIFKIVPAGDIIPAPTPSLSPTPTPTPIQTPSPAPVSTLTPTPTITPTTTPAQTLMPTPTPSPSFTAPLVSPSSTEDPTPSTTIPEFPIWIILPLSIMATLLIVWFAKRKISE